MMRLLRASLVAHALATAAGAQATSALAWSGLDRYREENAKLPAPAAGEARVVFMGNSITEGWAKFLPTQFPGKPYIGRGISGQTTPQMLVRFRQDVIALKPAAVVILAGTNDIAGNTGPSSIEMIEDNLASMAELGRANGIRVLLCSVLPVFDYPWRRGLEPAPKIMAINEWMKRYAAAHGDVYVDFHSAMQDERHGMKGDLAYDGVHPTEAGYRVMAAIVERGIAEALTGPRAPQESSDWVQLFNGRDLDDWVVKFKGRPLGENVNTTFRVEDGLLKVRYDRWSGFNGEFGHIFYKKQPFTHYIVAAEYRFVGEQVAGATSSLSWALRNNGIMVHSQSPESMGLDQDFPMSLEVQLLGGLGRGPRPTANLCTPGTNVHFGDSLVTTHCINSKSKTYDGDQWVRVEALVLGDSVIKHIVNGDTVLVYRKPEMGGGSANDMKPGVKVDGTPLRSGYIALQAETAPIDFRKIEIRDLSASFNVPMRRDANVPLPEHPRPDFERAGWLNLNGRWHFAFDTGNDGEQSGWAAGNLPGRREIMVPFSWGSPLSGVPDSGDVGWYSRSITIPEVWRGKRVFLVVGASDWRSTAWLDGQRVGAHQGGYTPFSFELSQHAKPGSTQQLVIRVDDTDHPFKLEGKQGYGKARGMWQTVYLEARGTTPLAAVHLAPKRDLASVGVDVRLLEPAPRELTLGIAFTNAVPPVSVSRRIPEGASTLHVDVPMANARRWSLADPFLHEVTAVLSGAGVVPDTVRTYFGMRTISVTNLPGTNYPYVALNGTPVFLQLALDQAYHPDGYYTFPTDSVLREEISRARLIGLNGLREHIKIEAPRKLYWADRLGVLIMADIPNWWGPPDSLAFGEHETALRGAIDRDFNHPSVFSWVLFNETWGLHTKVEGRDRYLPETQRRVVSVYRLAKSLDSTRLVEDNSPCCRRGHTETDLNSWHEYLPGWRWDAHVRRISDSTFPGSTWNFESGWKQSRQPMLNSEFGNVWGYNGSTGDVDWSWDYRRAMDVFRRNPKLAGWLYTEHHDVINEWNGYWRFDRTWKETGFGGLADSMTLRDLHSPIYVAVGDPDLSRSVRPGARIDVPLYASFLTGAALGDSLALIAELRGWNALGEQRTYSTHRRKVPYRPWLSTELAPLTVTMPQERSVAVLALRIERRDGLVLHHNFTTFVVDSGATVPAALSDGRRVRVASVPATAVRDAYWSMKQWTVLGDRKLNGAGSGFFEYRFPWPEGLQAADVASATFLVEASAKRLNGKDRDTTARQTGDYMRGGGFHDRSRNPNSYPMTSESKFPSAVTVRINGRPVGVWNLADDPADSRGILSWHAQPRDGRLHEAGSYGQLLRIPIPPDVLAQSARAGEVIIRLEVDEALPGGLAIYGSQFGRYPLDPTVLFVLR